MTRPKRSLDVTSEDDESYRCSPNDSPPYIGGVSARSDGSSPRDEAAKKILDLELKFHGEYKPQCQEILNNPPPDANERKKLYRKLSESILQFTLLEIDALGTLRMKGSEVKRNS